MTNDRKTTRLGLILLALSVSALAQQVDIRSTGAKCNGGDDAAAVQAAINATPNGGTVLITCQAGIGAAGLQLENRNNVTIQGAGGGAGFTSLAPTNNTIDVIRWSNLLLVTNCANCAVRNVVFQMNHQPVAALGLRNNQGVIVDGNQIYNVGDGAPDANNHAGPSAAIEAALNTGNQYTNNVIQHTFGWFGGAANGQSDGPRGMWIGNNGSVETKPLIAYNTITDTFHTGIAGNTDNATVTGNRIYDAGTGSANQKAGGACIKETNAASTQTFMSFNDLSFCNQGIQVENAGNITIQNNSIRGALDSGVYESARTTNLTITGNTFSNNKNGITLQGGNNWSISNNAFLDDPAQAQRVASVIRITPIWSGQPVGSIKVANNEIGTNTQAGVRIHDQGGQVSGVSINNNSILNSAGAGISINQSAPRSISNISQGGNCFSGNQGGSLTDNRGAMSAPAQSGSCPTAPSIALTSPVAGTGYAAPATVLLQASVNGNGAAITMVEYYSGATKIGQATSSPYSATWSNVAAGNYTITARATSSVGPATMSAGVPLVVGGGAAPPPAPGPAPNPTPTPGPMPTPTPGPYGPNPY